MIYLKPKGNLRIKAKNEYVSFIIYNIKNTDSFILQWLFYPYCF